MIIKPPKPGLGFGFWDLGFLDLVWHGLDVAILASIAKVHHHNIALAIFNKLSMFCGVECFNRQTNFRNNLFAKLSYWFTILLQSHYRSTRVTIVIDASYKPTVKYKKERISISTVT